jgi:hypothetical protein
MNMYTEEELKTACSMNFWIGTLVGAAGLLLVIGSVLFIGVYYNV